MTRLENLPAHLSRAELLAVLDDIRHGVETGDTLEGSIEFLLPYPEQCASCHGAGRQRDAYGTWVDCGACGGMGMGPAPSHDFDVRASYRIGNLQGQGGMRMIGELRKEEK